MHGNRANWLGKARRRGKLVRNRIPWGISLRLRVETPAGFKLAHGVASILGSSNNRVLIVMAPGVYPITVGCSVGVDICGEARVIISWAGARDTVDLNGSDTRLSDLIVMHRGDEFFYAIHADSPGPGGAQLVNVTAYSDSKSALGIGLHPGQSFTAKNCHFERGSCGLLSEPVLAHNSHLGNDGGMLFEGCTAYSATGDRLSVWTDAPTGQQSEILGIEGSGPKFGGGRNEK